MRKSGNVERVGEMTNVNKILVENLNRRDYLKYQYVEERIILK